MDEFGRNGGSSVILLFHGFIFIGLAVVTSFFAYLWGATSPNPAELLAPALFWYAVCFLLVAYPLRRAWQDFLQHIRTAFGAGVFALYLAIHVVLYGFLLESLLVSFFDQPYTSAAANVSITTSVFAPPSLPNAVLALWFNPWITLTIPPLFDDALSFYSISIAVVIAILIVANIGRTRELGRVCSANLRSRSMLIFPALGIVLGASCCLSVPVLITLAAPTAAALSASLWIYDVTYFFFPLFAVVLLYLNLQSVDKIASNVIRSPVKAGMDQVRRPSRHLGERSTQSCFPSAPSTPAGPHWPGWLEEWPRGAAVCEVSFGPSS